MLKNEKLVLKMSVEQKVQLLTSSINYQNNPVGKSGFPVFNLLVDPSNSANKFYTTSFPSDKALASSFNQELIKAVYKAKGIEANMCFETPIFNVNENDVSSSAILTGKVLSSKVAGLNQVGTLANFENIPSANNIASKEAHELITSLAFQKTFLKSVYIANESDIEDLLIKYKKNDLYFAKATSKEEVVRLLNKNCCLVFLDGVDETELTTYINACVERYEKAYEQLQENILTNEEFRELIEEDSVISVDKINHVSDELISLLVELTSAQDKLSEVPVSIENGNKPVLFDEKAHNEVGYKAAKESVVLLKNDKVIPLDRHLKVAVIGESAKNDAYFVNEANEYKANFEMPFEVINDFDIDATGFAYGYLKGQVDDDDTVLCAVKLAKDADYALVYLYAGKNETSLPKEQLQLIEALAKENVKIIAVVNGDHTLDLSFEQYCKAVLFTYSTGQNTARAVLDTLVGFNNPSAKLAYDGLTYIDDEPIVKYPFGYGLSLTTFHYYNLQINEKGISCTVTNTGEYDGFTTLQLYVTHKDCKGLLQNRDLRGFKKIFVRRNESLKIEIPFDNNTFKSYDPETKQFFIKGGEYQLELAESAVETKLKGVVKLAKYYFDDAGFENIVVDTSNDFEHAFSEFVDSADRRGFHKDRRGLPYGLKMLLTIIMMAYFLIISGLFLLTDIADADKPIFTLLAGLIGVLTLIIGITYIVRITKRHRAIKALEVNDTLTEVVEKVQCFEELAKVTYAEAVVKEEEPVEEEKQEEVEEVVVERSYVSEFEEVEDDVVYKDSVSFAEICNNFHDYALSKGIEIEIPSIRTLIAALSSTKMVFLNVANKDALPKFLEILNSFYGNTGITRASHDWHTQKDLLWKASDDKYLASDFTKTVHVAANDNKRNSIAIVDNVEIDNLLEYFATFIHYANHPTEDFDLALNDELTIQLPKNICYVLVPAETAYIEKLNKDLANASISVDLIISKCEPTNEEFEIKHFSYNDLTEIVTHAKEAHFLPEKIWMKIDELVETINLSERFVIGNKNVLQLEKMTSVLIDCGGDESEAFINAFTCKIVPLFKTLKLYKKDQGEKTLFNLIEKEFVDEDVSKIQKALTKKI